MKSQLINTYALLRERWPDYHIVLDTPPSYVKSLVGESCEDSIIFICKLDRLYKKAESPTNGKENLDLTGSPLKDSFKLNASLKVHLPFSIATTWTKTEEHYRPLPVSDAREILSVLNIDRPADICSDVGSVWVLCNGEDNEKTILLQAELGSGRNSRGVVRLLGQKLLKEIDLRSLQRQHEQMARRCENRAIHMETFFSFALQTTLKFSSAVTVQEMDSAVLDENNVVLRQVVNLGSDTGSAAALLWQQIHLLQSIFEDIRRFKEDGEANEEPEYRFGGAGIEMDILRKRIVHILSGLPLDVEPKEERVTPSDLWETELESVLRQAKDRELTEVTDQLWEILKLCGSYRDLNQAFAYLFRSVANQNVANMPRQTTQLGRLINDIAKQRLAIPILTGAQALELLLDIGLEKAKHDYEFVFGVSKVYNNIGDVFSDEKQRETTQKTVESLKSIRKSLHGQAAEMCDKQRKTLLHAKLDATSPEAASPGGFQNTRFDQVEIDATLSRLAQIHVIFEHLLSIQINLGLRNAYSSITEFLLQKPPIPIKKLMENVHDWIEVPISDDKILALIEEQEPSGRRIKLSSENLFRKVENVFYHSTDTIFPDESLAVFSHGPFNEADVGQKKHWCLLYTKISTMNQ